MRVCMNRIAASTEKPSSASAVVRTATSWRLKSSKVERVSRTAASAAQAGVVKGSVPTASATRPLRTSDEHDSSVRRIDTNTPDIVGPKESTIARRFGARHFPHRARIKRQYRQGDSRGKSPDRERD